MGEEWKLVVVSSPLSLPKATDSPALTTFAAVEAPSKLGGVVMAVLKGFPLSSEYGHLKRIRKSQVLRRSSGAMPFACMDGGRWIDTYVSDRL